MCSDRSVESKNFPVCRGNYVRPNDQPKNRITWVFKVTITEICLYRWCMDRLSPWSSPPAWSACWPSIPAQTIHRPSSSSSSGPLLQGIQYEDWMNIRGISITDLFSHNFLGFIDFLPLLLGLSCKYHLVHVSSYCSYWHQLLWALFFIQSSKNRILQKGLWDYRVLPANFLWCMIWSDMCTYWMISARHTTNRSFKKWAVTLS